MFHLESQFSLHLYSFFCEIALSKAAIKVVFIRSFANHIFFNFAIFISIRTYTFFFALCIPLTYISLCTNQKRNSYQKPTYATASKLHKNALYIAKGKKYSTVRALEAGLITILTTATAQFLPLSLPLSLSLSCERVIYICTYTSTVHQSRSTFHPPPALEIIRSALIFHRAGMEGAQGGILHTAPPENNVDRTDKWLIADNRCRPLREPIYAQEKSV